MRVLVLLLLAGCATPSAVAAPSGCVEGLTRRADREERAMFSMLGVFGALHISTIAVASEGTDRPRHFKPWAKIAVPTIIGVELVAVGATIALAAASGRHRAEATRRDGCP